MGNYYLSISGGVGDIIKRYFWGHHGWNNLRYIKKQPNNKVKLIVNSSNPAAFELFKYNPHIDNIVVSKWINPNTRQLPPAEFIKGYAALSNIRPPVKEIIHDSTIYLSDKDKKELEDLKIENKNIVMHPFAGQTQRMHLTTNYFYELALKIIDRYNCQVIILGGDSRRATWGDFVNIPESFQYRHDRILNLVNKTNLRLSTIIARKSSYFIGTNSCFYCTRLGDKTPATVYINTQPQDYLYNKELKHLRLAVREHIPIQVLSDKTLAEVKKFI